MTIGVNPTYPSTGYGYIQFSKDKLVNVENVYKVKNFTEKPNKETAMP